MKKSKEQYRIFFIKKLENKGKQEKLNYEKV